MSRVGPINTDLLRAGVTPEQIEFIGSLNPNNRIGEAEEVASVITFIAGPEASWVNGQNLGVNGVCVFSSSV